MFNLSEANATMESSACKRYVPLQKTSTSKYMYIIYVIKRIASKSKDKFLGKHSFVPHSLEALVQEVDIS